MQNPKLSIKSITDSCGAIIGAEIYSTHNKACFARHDTCFIRNSDGILEVKQIDAVLYDRIAAKFKLSGDTECFTLDLSSPEPRSITPDSVRHQLTSSESSFTSTGAKLDYHWPIFHKFRDSGYGSIIRATLTLHQKCSSKCPYCSTIARNASDSISLDEAKSFVNSLYRDQEMYNQEYFPSYNQSYRDIHGCGIRLRGLILSGGGQPNLWPHFAEFVEWLSTLNISLGLITNGFPKTVHEDVYKAFDWIRISITPEDASPHYVNNRFDLQYLPKTIIRNGSITVGYSYVYGSWTKPEILSRISRSISDNQFNYCRLLTDCNLSRGSQLIAHQNLSDMLLSLDFIDELGNPKDKLFHQLKYHGTPHEADSLWTEGQCYLQSYNVFWDTTGHDSVGYSYCYPCDSVTVLTDELPDSSLNSSQRRFDSSIYGTVRNTHVANLYSQPLHPFFDPREVCKSCLFMRNNRKVKALAAGSPSDIYTPPELVGDLQHVNFP